MRILIDLQAAQSVPHGTRGIGRYAIAFTRALARVAVNDEVFVMLNSSLEESAKHVRRVLSDYIPTSNVVCWVPAQANNDILYRLKLEEVSPDVVITTSFFEGYVDTCYTDALKESRAQSVCILYDLIPQLFSDIYLTDPEMREWYESKVSQLRDFKLLLAISESTANDARRLLDSPSTPVVNISSAVDEMFRAVPITAGERERLEKMYGLGSPFIMYTGGIDHRKNIEGLLEAFSFVPAETRAGLKLAVVCSISNEDRERLLSVAASFGLAKEDIVFTGYVSDEDLVLIYNSCEFFVFPSLYEGFGLPVLEAMKCGKAVLASSTSSLPEVVGRDDALFDANDPLSISKLITRTLVDVSFRHSLEKHASLYSSNFDWDLTAARALEAIRALFGVPPEASRGTGSRRKAGAKPKLAYISPMPPERSGISDYSALLVTTLGEYYDIFVISPQGTYCGKWCSIIEQFRTPDWFVENSAEFHRVLYNFGNSDYHSHMFELLERIPGAVILHDFFLSGVQFHRSVFSSDKDAWSRSLAVSHGYKAIVENDRSNDVSELIWRYPANLLVLQDSLGVIVHSKYSASLADSWYGTGASSDWCVIPMPRRSKQMASREVARKKLGLSAGDFIIVSLGAIGRSKLSQKIVERFCASPLSRNPNVKLIFVGQNDPGPYGDLLMQQIQSMTPGKITVTGWTDEDHYHLYLCSADAGIQLRSLSRGETSAAVLDCMSYGLPTIVNANGSMAELPDDSVIKISDQFSDSEIDAALLSLVQDVEITTAIGLRASRYIDKEHSPERVGDLCYEAIERIYAGKKARTVSHLKTLAHRCSGEETETAAAFAACANFSPSPRRRQLFVDLSEIVQRNAGTGIQRVTMSIMTDLIVNPPSGYEVRPVFAEHGVPGYRYANNFVRKTFDLRSNLGNDDPIDSHPGDLFLALDYQPHIIPQQEGFIQQMFCRGVDVWFVIYDMLPLSLTSAFLPGADIDYTRWLKIATGFNGVVCISRAVADEVTAWLDASKIAQRARPAVHHFHLGADFRVGEVIKRRAPGGVPVFLMVGTIEPRKGHRQVLEAFEILWSRGVNADLLIIGKRGWMVDDVIDKILHNQSNNRPLRWFERIDDGELGKVYESASCLIAASTGEGFGLPLIEAARHSLPIIARDIPVFREVAGEHAAYFSGTRAEDLALAIEHWLASHARGEHPRPEGMPWLTWAQSVERLKSVLGLDNDGRGADHHRR